DYYCFSTDSSGDHRVF
nr:immunoglobulin light chain junction region [Macaca mulatta]MOW30430.1 immunoglobulin light chain junction region [Macaca mulatta]